MKQDWHIADCESQDWVINKCKTGEQVGVESQVLRQKTGVWGHLADSRGVTIRKV